MDKTSAPRPPAPDPLDALRAEVAELRAAAAGLRAQGEAPTVDLSVVCEEILDGRPVVWSLKPAPKPKARGATLPPGAQRLRVTRVVDAPGVAMTSRAVDLSPAWPLEEIEDRVRDLLRQVGA